MHFFKKNYGLFLVLLLSFWAIKPLLSSGFFPMHDDTQVARVFEMGKALIDRMFPVRWVQDLGYGYGYPIFNFYAPLAYYFGGFLIVLGFDALIATKIMMMVGILLSGVFMYLLAKEFWGKVGGVLSGLFYVYVPYHALDIYVRGDVAEFWAYAFIPLVFYGLHKTYKEGKWKFVIIGSIGYAGIILSHNLTAMMVTPFVAIVILLYCYIAYKNKNLSTIYYLLSTIFLGLALASFYWIPALLEMKYTNVLSQVGGGADFRDHFACIGQLWDSPWGFGGSTQGCIDGISFKIGKLYVLAVFMALLIVIAHYTMRHSGERSDSRISTDLRDSGQARMTVFILLAILGFAISVFFTLEVSRPIWEIIPQMAFFQYPWRFLILVSFFSSLIAGFIIWFIKIRLGSIKYLNTVLYLSAGGLIFFLIYFNSKLFQPQTLVLKTSEDYTNEKTLKWFTSKISDEYMPKNHVKPTSIYEIPNDKISILQGDAKILELFSNSSNIKALIAVKSDAKIQINIASFPAWNIVVDSKKVTYLDSGKGLILELPLGNHRVDLRFAQTPIEKSANLISMISLIVLFIGIIFKKKVAL